MLIMQGLTCEDVWEAKCIRLAKGDPWAEQGRCLGTSRRCGPCSQPHGSGITDDMKRQSLNCYQCKSRECQGRMWGISRGIASPSGAASISRHQGTGSGGAAGALPWGHSESKRKCFKNPVLSIHPGHSFHLTCTWDTSAWGFASRSKHPACWKPLRSLVLPLLPLPPFLAATGLQDPCPSSILS